MRLTRLRIENFKGLREIDIPISAFVCLIGENNAGKSSVLQALALFFSGNVLAKSNYFEPAAPVRIQVTLSELKEDDLARLAEEHRPKIKAIVKDEELTLVRLYGIDGKSVLKYRKMLPADKRFSDDNLAQLLKGKRPGQSFVTEVCKVFPELNGTVTSSMSQYEIKDIIQRLADSLPNDQKVESDAELPTGIDKSVYGILPEPIYIPAVKDLKDDVKTSESTPFGKVLGILLKAIEPHLTEEKTLFDQLNAKLNRVVKPDGSEADERLSPVRTIEQTVEKYVQDSFRSVKLKIKIPPPELKTVLSSALIFANDGVDGPIDTKGDGLRRAIVFAILRSYVELSKTGLIADPNISQTQNNSRLILLFEEPELYLHPKAQQILFTALGAFSNRHPVFVTTHSPAFFGPCSTTTFIKMRKKEDPALASRPFGAASPIDLGNTSARDQFQIICYENNNIAFFADTIVLVEGDSDFIILPHLAKTVNETWDQSQLPLRFARIGGKGNIRRYKEFFARFEARVVVVTDLDFLLGSEFSQIDPSDAIKTLRDQLFAALDAAIHENGEIPEPSDKQVKEANQKGDLRALWRNVRELRKEHKNGTADWEKVEQAIEEFFAWEKYCARREFLKGCPNPEILSKKRLLLTELRKQQVCVLEKGAIEDYYPEGIKGDGKPARAQHFCKTISTREQAIALSAAGHLGFGEVKVTEFEAIFQMIFQC